MTWFADSSNQNEASKTKYFPFLAVDFDFPSDHYRFWTGAGEIVLNGQTYLGLGDLVKIESESETTELGPQRKKYTLSGVQVDPAVIDEDDIDGSFGRSITEYLGFLNPETKQLIANPEINWEGRNDSFRRVDGEAPLSEVSAENILALLDRSDDWRYTNEHQQEFFPGAGDTGFDQVPTLPLKKVVWGGKSVDPAVQGKNPAPYKPRFKGDYGQ
jgi:hypothetical protein